VERVHDRLRQLTLLIAGVRVLVGMAPTSLARVGRSVAAETAM